MRAFLTKKNTISRSEKAAVYLFLKWQCIIALFLVVGASIVFSHQLALSVLLGCAVTILPNIALACFLFMCAKKRSSKQTVRACYVGELLKLVLIAIMMVVILRFFHVQFGPFLVGFFGTYMLYWMAPIILRQG